MVHDSITPIAVRSAELRDVPLILNFVRDLAEYERRAGEVVATEAALCQTLFGPRPAAEVLLAEINGVAEGFALFFGNYSTFLGQPGLYLEDLFVRPEARGRGVGRRLLAELARLAMERHCGRLEWSVLDWNAPAIKFYESLGATPQAEWTTYRLTGDELRQLGTQANQ